MAAKKKTTTSKKSGSSSAKKPKKPPVLTISGKCSQEKICQYLTALNTWFYGEDGNSGFIADYIELRIAVCNVERRAFGVGGVPLLTKRFCQGGTGEEPADPAKPPVWDI